VSPKGVIMPIYETIVILDSLLSMEDIDKIVNRFKDIIEGEKGKIIEIDKWGKRRLAYDIKKKQYGFYISLVLEGHEKIPVILEREYNFNDNVLRYLSYRFDKNKLTVWQKGKAEKEKSSQKTKKSKLDPHDKMEVSNE
jgi:small subunit ribosomal protein S6